MTKLLPAFAYDESTSVIEDVPGATGALVVPDGSTVQRPSTPANGMVRFNTTTREFEAYQDAQWAHMIGAQTDPTVVWLHDDFTGFISGTSMLSDNTWSPAIVGGGAGPTAFTVGGVGHPHYGVKEWRTATVSGQGYVLLPVPGGAPMGNFNVNVPWELHWVFRLFDITDVRFRIGLTSANLDAEPTDGIFLRFDTTIPMESNWMVQCRASGVSSPAQSTEFVNTNFHRIRIRSVTAGEVIFNLDNGGDKTITSNVPSAPLLPAAHCVTTVNAFKGADYDLCTFRLRGVGR